jgi:serine/threonine-protein kinase
VPEGSSPTESPEAAARRRRQPALLGALALITGLALWGWLRHKPAEAPTATARFEFSPPRERAVRSETGRNVAISPDGSRVVYVGAAPSASTMLYMRRLGDVEISPVPGSDGGSQPFFSPDGSWIGFYTTAALKKVPIAGGPALTITRLTALIRGPRWGADGNILYSDYRNRLMRVSAAGGTAMPLPVADTTGRYRWPELLPDGKAVLLSTPEHQVGILDLETGKVTTLLPEGDGPIYLASGFLLYGHQSQSLLAVPFDLKRRTVTGSPVPVLQGVQVFSGGAVQLGLSSGGVAAYLAGASAQGQLRLVDSTGAETPLPPKGASMELGRFSPDGRRIAYAIAAQAGGAQDIYILDIARGTSTRLSGQTSASSPVWSRNGEFVAYSGPGPQGPDIYQRRADGSEAEQLLASFPGDQDIADFAPDGRLVVINYSDISNIDIVTPGAKAVAEPYLHEAWHDYEASLSPDGKWLAYTSRETGNDEVYVRAYPTAKGKWQLSQGGGSAPRWASDGRTLFYIRDDSLLATTVRSGTSFEVGARRWAVRWPYEQAFATMYDVSPDGKRFAVVSFPDVGAVTVATNWFTELRERLAGAATSGGTGSRP